MMLMLLPAPAAAVGVLFRPRSLGHGCIVCVLHVCVEMRMDECGVVGGREAEREEATTFGWMARR